MPLVQCCRTVFLDYIVLSHFFIVLFSRDYRVAGHRVIRLYHLGHHTLSLGHHVIRFITLLDHHKQ
jgi:hypothetical protein